MTLALVLAAATVISSALAVMTLGAEGQRMSGVPMTHWFFDQLTEAQKPFYRAMEKMLADGTFKTGDGSLDMTEDDAFMTQATASAYMNGNNPAAGNLLTDFAAARDAFYADNPDVFYVDFSALSVRITKGTDGVHHVYIGAGRNTTYYTEGFTSKDGVDAAIKEYDAALGELVDGAKKVDTVQGQTKEAAMAGYVHDTLIRQVTYKLENACKPENKGFIRTAYGALVCGEGVCEAYTRAFKAAMDELGIPCVMVSGVFMHDRETPEQHIWNYVELEGAWYGVDATMDDPISPTGGGKDGVDGYENREYFLAGAERMAKHHYPSGILSGANYEFSYPGLNYKNYGVAAGTTDSAFSVLADYNGIDQDGGTDQATVFTLSYLGMGAGECVKNGYYMLQRYVMIDDETGDISYEDWGYLLPEAWHLPGDRKEALTVSLSYNGYVQFAVTTKSPGDYKDQPELLFFHGSNSELLAMTDILRVSSDYKIPPYPKTASPSMQSTLIINGTTYTMEIEFTDDLVPVEGEKIDIDLECFYNEVRQDKNGQYTKKRIDVKDGVATSKLTDIVWDENTPNKLTFKFKPSDMFAADSVFYTFHIKGLVGKQSGKAPIELTYGADHPCAVCALQSQGWDWNVFGKPQLMEGYDPTGDGWETEDGEPIDEELTHRLMLVTTTTSPKEKEEMDDLIGDEFPDETVEKTETYNIKLTLCKKQIIKTGQSVYISLGFPEGYGPEDAGVTFKAYHFIKDDAGNTVGVEEIPCYITEYGLIIEVKSFSPFAIAAVKDDGTAKETGKNVIITSSEGGSAASGKGTVFTLGEGASEKVTVSAGAGYVIDTLTVNGEQVANAAGQTSVELTVSAADADKLGNVKVSATFAAEAVVKAEAARGETVEIPPATVAHVHVWSTEYTKDETGHYRTCTECGEAEMKAEHTGKYSDPDGEGGELPDDCTKASFTCDVCGYEVAGAKEHVLETVQTADGTMHYKKCENCKYETAPVAHEYFETLSHDENGHWQLCHCGHTTATVAHTMKVDEKTEAGHSHVCSDCGYKTATVAHVYTYEKDESGHVGTCSDCGFTAAKEAHSYDDKGVCVCGAVKAASQQPADTDKPGTQKPDDTTAAGSSSARPSATGDESKYALWAVVTAISAVAVAIIIIDTFRRSKKKEAPAEAVAHAEKKDGGDSDGGDGGGDDE